MVEGVDRLRSWWRGRLRRRRRCASRAPVGYMDGLHVRHLYRWSPRCELARGHDGTHRAADEEWADPTP